MNLQKSWRTLGPDYFKIKRRSGCLKLKYEAVISASCTLYAAHSRSEEQKRAAILNYCFLQQSPAQVAEFVHWRTIKRHRLHKNSGKKKEVLFVVCHKPCRDTAKMDEHQSKIEPSGRH
ncbi:hypothetical protein GOODEAATRI_032575 [Goodea atripinnis]|uniref:Uncharacterized protein n=1 Tax=Goodea atripinnis TaxID=208336 RepID=A0ABV0P9J4_9TELE